VITPRSTPEENTLEKSAWDLKTDPQISPVPIIGIIFFLGIALYFGQDLLVNFNNQQAMAALSLLCYVAAGTSWYVNGKLPMLSRWMIVASLQLIIYLAYIWLKLPELLVYQFVLSGLSVILISVRAGLFVSIIISVTTIVVPNLVFGRLPDVLFLAITSIWLGFGLLAAAYWHMQSVVAWAWDHYQQGQHSLEESRQRKADLEQTLVDFETVNRHLVRLNRLASALRHEADEARRVKEEFVANISHELRTPINMIIGFSKMIIDSPKLYGHMSASLLSDLAVIHRNAEQLSMLINDVLDLSQIESGAMALIKEYMSIRDVIEPAVEAVHPLFLSKDLYLEADIQENLPQIYCDRTRLREVMLNLLSNAGRFTDKGGVRITARQEHGSLLIAVADTGRGIAEKDLSKLFQPFQQVDNSIRRIYGGSGLGLHISKQIIELHNGRISVESKLSEGTVFTIQLPIDMTEQAGFPTGADYIRKLQPGWEYLEPVRPKTLPITRLRPRFVVLEPENALQRILHRYLGETEIVPVHTLTEALDELEKQPSQALVVNDSSVSGALQKINEIVLPKGTPAIVCNLPRAEGTPRDLGVADYLIKPISQEKLLSTLEKFQLSGNTVLLIEDNPDATRLFRRMLSSSPRQYRVIRASNGEEGLQLLRKHRPDIVLLDLIMPKMNGFQFLESLRSTPEFSDLPVIIISARDPSGHPIVCQTLAVTAMDGLSVAQLLASIKSLCEILSTPALPPGPAS
jgi:signal transduction histidine kinase/CheY-like chemotaxis protein